MNREHGGVGAILLFTWIGGSLLWWGLAFTPTGGQSPEWLAAARSVCFGTLDNGLPDNWGWVLLGFGPATFGAALWIGWNREVTSLLSRMIRRPFGLAVLALLLAAHVVLGAWVVSALHYAQEVAAIDYMSAPQGALPEHYPRTDRPAPDFSLVDQHGSNVSLDTFRGNILIFTFAFANCKTICPAVIHQSAEALRQLGDDARLAVCTLDPWRDTPASLQRMVESLAVPRGAHVLSGKIPDVLSALEAYDMPWTRDESTGDVTHPALTYVIDPAGNIAYVFNNATTAWIVDAARRVGRGS